MANGRGETKLETKATGHTLDRRAILLGSTAFAATSALWTSAAQAQTLPAQKPNILFMLVDNLGYGELGVYGVGATLGAPTPRIDRTARVGLRLRKLNLDALVHARP